MDEYRAEVGVGTPQEQWRWESARTKEPGTTRWIEMQVRPGDVFYDIGANIGVYTLMAQQLIGDGQVYAFEPHITNAHSLLKNLSKNPWCKGVQVITCPLHDRGGFHTFYYSGLGAGSSGHQLGHAVDEYGRAFVPAATEIKYATTIATLIREKAIKPATLIKMDVDGNEPAILRGMEPWIHDDPLLRSIQVEVHPATDAQVVKFMEGCGFQLVERHFTEMGQRALDAGVAQAKISHNAVFCRL